MSDPIQLHPGENVFEIVATDAAHVQARITFVARYTPSAVVPVQNVVTRSNGKGVTKEEILSLLNGEVPSGRVTAIVRERGIGFVPTEDDLKEVRAAGGGDDLVNVLIKAKHRQ
jgi:hypothetical protein